jgi:type II secretory ATPase GspE/PulE/Tfp pilus assembly ATPase PilB-like protein
MDDLLNLKETDLIKKYDGIIKTLMQENLLNLSSDIVYPSSSKFFIDTLLSLGVNHNLIYNKIKKEFNLTVFNNIEAEDLFVNSLGVIHEGTFYLKNPFSNISKRTLVNNKKTSYFDKIGIISEDNYNKIINKNEKNENYFESLYFLTSIIEKAVKEGVSEIFIPNNKESGTSDIFFNFNNNYYEVEEKYEFSFLPDIDNLQDFLGEQYYVDFNIVKSEDKDLFFIYLNKYHVDISIDELDKKYALQLNEMITSSSGLFLISEKNETNLYYIMLDSLRKKTNKKIISFEHKIKSNIKDVLQTTNINNEDLNLSLFDVVFIKNVKGEEEVELIINSLQQGKLVVISTISQDSLTALSTLISSFDIDKYLLSEKIIGVYHSTILPKVCDSCSVEYPIKKSPLLEEKKFQIYKMSVSPDHLIKKANLAGCSLCNKGYVGKVVVSELLENDKDVSGEIENNFNIRELRNLKQSKRWETIQSYSKYLVERNIVTLEDVKKSI